jgi:hypothetical protein
MGARIATAACAFGLVACALPLAPPPAPEVAPLRVGALQPALSFRCEPIGADDWRASRYGEVVARALRTARVFTRVEAEDESAPLRARVLVEVHSGNPYLPFFPVLSFWRERLELDFELEDAAGRRLFEHHETRSWSMVASVLFLSPSTSDPAAGHLHAFVRSALARALASGALPDGRDP